MTTTTTFKGMDPSARSSSRVLRPPGGGSNFNLGFDLPKEQQGTRRNKMASTIFGTPEENPPSWARSRTKPDDVDENSEMLDSQTRNSFDANSGDCVDPKGGEIEASGLGSTVGFLEVGSKENTEFETEAASGLSEEKPLPAAPVPSPVAPAPAPSRRNPPGGKSSLVLG